MCAEQMCWVLKVLTHPGMDENCSWVQFVWCLRETLISDELRHLGDATQQFALSWSANNKSSIATSLEYDRECSR